MMALENILIAFSLLAWNFLQTDGFETDKCDHGNITASLRKLQTCLRAEDDTGEDDICHDFKSSRECVTSNLEQCFTKANVERIANETLGEIRLATTELLLNPAFQKIEGFVLTEAQVDSLYSACPNIPDKSFSENVERKLFFALEAGVRTDDNCTENEITKVNVGGGAECVKLEMENAKSQLNSRLRSARGSYQSTICSVLDGTVGKCLRKPFPECFSERERVFLKKTMAETLQNRFKEAEDLLGSKLGQISFSDCSVFSGSRMNYPTSSIVYVVLAISSFFVIN